MVAGLMKNIAEMEAGLMKNIAERERDFLIISYTLRRIVRNELSCAELSAPNCPAPNCPAPNCPDTVTYSYGKIRMKSAKLILSISRAKPCAKAIVNIIS